MLTHKKYIILLISLLAVCPLWADGLFFQDYSYTSMLGIKSASGSISPDECILQALGSDIYPVTQGDTYTLTYFNGKDYVSEQIQVSGNNVKVGSLYESFSIEGLTYREFKTLVEESVLAKYPYSTPTLTLTGCGVFLVRVYGEVFASDYAKAWGLSRLSDFAGYATDYASTREVIVHYPDNSTKTYDLYSSLIENSEEDNPLLSAGCSVEFVKAPVTVCLTGHTLKTGVFQTEENETVYDLIETYGDGTLLSASTEVTVSNYVDGIWQQTVLSIEDSKNVILKNGDCIDVPGEEDTYVTVMGSVSKPGLYAYVPYQGLDYYIAKAGGYTSEAKIGSERITDSNGNNVSSERYILSGSTINVPANAKTDLALVISIVGLVSSVLTIVVTSMNLFE